MSLEQKIQILRSSGYELCGSFHFTISYRFKISINRFYGAYAAGCLLFFL